MHETLFIFLVHIIIYNMLFVLRKQCLGLGTPWYRQGRKYIVYLLKRSH